MNYIADELLAADRAVRNALGVRDGQTIENRARELLAEDPDGRHLAFVCHEPDCIRGQSAVLLAALAVLADPGWRGLKAAAQVLDSKA